MPSFRVWGHESQTISWQMMVEADSVEEAQDVAFDFLQFGINEGTVEVEDQALVSTDVEIVEAYADHG